MNIKNSTSWPDTTNACYDDMIVYIVSSWKSGILLSALEPVAFKFPDRFSLNISYNPLLSPCVDDNCIYFPTREGEILGIDKFSGSKMMTSDLGMNIPVGNLEQNEQHVICLCGTPIVLPGKTDIETFCVCVINKETGQKIAQTQAMRSKFLPSMTYDHLIWAISDKTFFGYSSTGECLSQHSLNFSSPYPPICTDNFVACVSDIGTAEIFRKENGSLFSKIIIEKNSSPPIAYQDNLIWFTENHVSIINVSNQRVQKHKNKYRIRYKPVRVNDCVYALDEIGNLIAHNIKDQNTVSIKMPEKCNRIIPIDELLVVLSSQSIYTVEI